MKLSDIMNIRGIFAARENEVYSVRLALKILKFKKSSAAEAEFYAKRHNYIVDTCAQTDEDGNFIFSENGGILLLPERVSEYRKQMQELDTTESEVEFKFSEAELGELKLSISEMENIADFIVEGEL